MHVQAPTYAVLTHKSFPSIESGRPTFFFLCLDGNLSIVLILPACEYIKIQQWGFL